MCTGLLFLVRRPDQCMCVGGTSDSFNSGKSFKKCFLEYEAFISFKKNFFTQTKPKIVKYCC